MAQQYSSTTITNTTFTATTKANITDNLKNALVASGWSASGSSGAWTCTSQTTPSGLKCIIVTSIAPTNCATIQAKNKDGIIFSTNVIHLYPDGTTWRIICNGYQFFIMKDSSESANRRDFGFVGVPYIPSFLSITDCVVLGGNANNDTDTDLGASFRNNLTYQSQAMSIVAPSTKMYFHTLNGTTYDAGTNETGKGALALRVGASPKNITEVDSGAYQTFFDGSVLIDTPYICFGQSGASATATINGIIWDAVIVEKGYAYGTTKTMDSKTWLCITSSNSGNTTTGRIRGSLFVRTT